MSQLIQKLVKKEIRDKNTNFRNAAYLEIKHHTSFEHSIKCLTPSFSDSGTLAFAITINVIATASTFVKWVGVTLHRTGSGSGSFSR